MQSTKVWSGVRPAACLVIGNLVAMVMREETLEVGDKEVLEALATGCERMLAIAQKP